MSFACVCDERSALLKACSVLFSDGTDYSYSSLVLSAHCLHWKTSLIHLHAVGACLGPEAAAGG